MKKILFIVFRILIAIVLIGKISNWFLNYSDETNQVLNATMFMLIGIAYLVAGYVWDTKLIKITFLVSGLYLMVISFVPDFYLKPILGIACILTPMILVRFSPEDPDEDNEVEIVENKKYNWNLIDLTWKDLFSRKKQNETWKKH